MRSRISIMIILFYFAGNNTFCQFRYDNSGDIFPFSCTSFKIQKVKKNKKINALHLPIYNNDSLYWAGNIGIIIMEIEGTTNSCVRNVGFPIDTLIHFFDCAKRIRIREGFVWLYKIQSPTASELSLDLNFSPIDTSEYISVNSNGHEITFNDIHNTDVLQVYSSNDADYNKNKKQDNEHHWSCRTLMGNELYVEVYSKSKSIEKTPFDIIRINYRFRTNYRLNEAPNWIREKYPDIDFK